MLFPKMTIDVLPRLTRFDLDFDLPKHVLPEKAPPIVPIVDAHSFSPTSALY